jgi:hypothetical protein
MRYMFSIDQRYPVVLNSTSHDAVLSDPVVNGVWFSNGGVSSLVTDPCLSGVGELQCGSLVFQNRFLLVLLVGWGASIRRMIYLM